MCRAKTVGTTNRFPPTIETHWNNRVGAKTYRRDQDDVSGSSPSPIHGTARVKSFAIHSRRKANGRQSTLKQ